MIMMIIMTSAKIMVKRMVAMEMIKRHVIIISLIHQFSSRLPSHPKRLHEESHSHALLLKAVTCHVANTNFSIPYTATKIITNL